MRFFLKLIVGVLSTVFVIELIKRFFRSNKENKGFVFMQFTVIQFILCDFIIPGCPLNFSVTEATDLLQKLTLEPKTKTHDAPEVTKKVHA